MTGTALHLDLADAPIEPGVTLIEASAGTGKTYCLTGLVLRLLLERRVDGVGSILVMTFTNAATAELIARIRTVLRSAIGVFEGHVRETDDFLLTLAARHGDDGLRVLRAALRDLDDLEICTIHGFCRRVLQQHALDTGTPFDVEYVEDVAALLERAAEDFWRRELYPQDDLIAAIGVYRDWTPEFFTEIYKDCRSHPRVVVEPEPLSVAEAIAGVRSAADAVRHVWNRDAVERALRGLKYKREHKPTEPLLQMRLDALKEFCSGRNDTAAPAVLETCSEPLRKLLTDAGKTSFVPFEFCTACDDLARAVARLEHALRCRFARAAGSLLEAEKRRTGTAGFDDLLHRLHEALQSPARAEALRRTTGRTFRAVLVDEFQDTDSLQYEIFRALFDGAFLFFIGDPKQAIYSFRGADVFAYLRAKRDAAQVYTLGSNWRSESRLVRAVSALFQRNERPFRHVQIPFIDVSAAGKADKTPIRDDTRAPLQWIWIGHHSNKNDGAEAACAVTVAEIARLVSSASGVKIGSEPVQPKHITVLVRTNAQAKQIQDTLRSAGIPAVMSRSGNVFASDEASDLRTLLTAVLTPADARAARGALATRIWGCGAYEIAALTVDDSAWESVVERFEDLRDAWAREGFVAMIQRLLHMRDVRPRLLAQAGGERRLTNLLHLVELANNAAAAQHFSAEALSMWLSAAIAHPSEHEGDTTELRLESDAEAVQIVTIHKSKGLEYDIVFCPFWDAREHTADPPLLVQTEDGRAFYICEGPVEEARARSFQDEKESEEARLAYVALTRAKHRCYVVWGQIGRNPASSALAQLLHAGASPVKDDGSIWRTQLADFCRAHPDLTAVCDPKDLAPIVAGPAPTASAPTLVARSLGSDALARLEPWRVASFSSLRARGAASAPRGVEIPDHSDPAERGTQSSLPVQGMAGFARGARAGTCLHEILERCDFTCVTDDETSGLIAEVLRRHGLGKGAARATDPHPEKTVRDMLVDVTRSDPPGAGFSLSSVPRDARLNEWQFYLPMARISRHGLADCFARHGKGDIATIYAPMLDALGTREVRGFLTGFVDLVFAHRDRWYVIDWKSNYLGGSPSDYDDAALARSMREHHYVLQYHLYVLALDRYLTQRLRGYDYERHFGGVYYAYLRGIHPDTRTGWYADRPPHALVEALDRLMRDGSER